MFDLVSRLIQQIKKKEKKKKERKKKSPGFQPVFKCRKQSGFYGQFYESFGNPPNGSIDGVE